MAHILRLKAKATGEENLLLFYHIPSEDLPLEEKKLLEKLLRLRKGVISIAVPLCGIR